MMRQRVISTIVVTAVLLGALSELSGSTAAARSHGRSTVTVSRHIPPRRGIASPHGRRVIRSPWRRRFVRLGPPCPRRVVIHTSILRPIVIGPLPTITVNVPTVRIEPATLTVWITNSNGSKTSVQLTRDGLWYVGPRGELYDSLPTNEQLRVVYGF